LRVIDRYILREFLRSFVSSLGFFTILSLIVRFSEKEMGVFISKHMSASASMLSLALQIPGYMIQVAPPSMLFAVFFSLGRMSQNNEITAMKALGLSLYRIFLPVFIAALMIAVLMVAFNDQVVTWATGKDADIKQSYSQSPETATHVVFMSTGGRIFYIYLMHLQDHRMQGVTIYEFDEKNNVRREIFASEASRNGETWYLKQGVIRSFNEGRWEEVYYKNKEIKVPEDPEVMVKGAQDVQQMSLAELSKLIRYKKEAGQVVRKDLVTLHDRISFPFACFIMAILGAPLFVVFGRSGMAVGFLLTMFISFLYWSIAIAVFEAFGNNGKMPPALSCWAANVIFAVVGAVFVYKVKK